MAAKNSYVLHMIQADVWHEALKVGSYSPASLQKEGFIHCSTREQVLKIANAFYKGQKNLLLLKINPKKLKAKFQYDYSNSLKDSFPHIYGPLNADAVEEVLPFPVNDAGLFELPAALKDGST